MENGINQIINNPLLIKFIVATIGIIIINFVFRFLRKSVAGKIKDSETRYQVRKIITFLGYFAVIIFILIVFYERLRSFTIAFGVIGAGIAFALQEVITSLAGWVAINTEHFYRIGDRIELAKIKGDVIDISILRTTIMELGEWVEADLYTGRIVRIANSFVFKEPVYNYSGDFPYLWDQIMVPVKYGSDHRLARKIILETANEIVGSYISEAETAWKIMLKKFVIEPARVQPMVTMIANDNWLEFTLRYVVDYKKRVVTKDMLFTRILDEFNATNGKVGFASATFQLVDAPPLEINLNDKRKE